MIDDLTPPAPIDGMPSPLRELAIATANQLLDAGYPFDRAVVLGAQMARQLQVEAIPSDVDLDATILADDP